jgi:outer membrane protein TolC
VNGLLDLPACTVLDLVELPLPPLPVQCPEEAAAFAVAHSPEVREAEQAIAKAEAALKVARMEYLPDVNVIGGVANQTFANYIQDNFSYLGLTASYTFWDWGKRKEVKRQRETQITLAHQNVRVTADKVRQGARKAYGEYAEALEAYQLAGEMVQARKEAEKTAEGQAAFQARADSARAELEYLKAEVALRVAHAQLSASLCER